MSANNSDLRQRIEEIHKQLKVGLLHDSTCNRNDCYLVKPDDPHFGITEAEAINAILSAFIESLPEKKNIGELREFHARLGTSGEQQIIEALGYNQALTDIKTIMSKGGDNVV